MTRYAGQRAHDVTWMTAAERETVYALTWGQGGPRYTLTGLTLREAQDQAATVRAWGPVILARACGDVLRSHRTGRPWHDQDADKKGDGS